MLIVRQATPQDLDDLARIWFQTASFHYGPIFGGASDDFTIDSCRAWWTSHVEFGFIAHLDGTAIGSVYGGPESHGHVARLYVLPEVWRSGAGHALAQAAEASLARQGFAEVQLWCLAQNELAHQFWRKRNWVHDGRRVELKPGIWDFGFAKKLTVSSTQSE